MKFRLRTPIAECKSSGLWDWLFFLPSEIRAKHCWVPSHNVNKWEFNSVSIQLNIWSLNLKTETAIYCKQAYSVWPWHQVVCFAIGCCRSRGHSKSGCTQADFRLWVSRRVVGASAWHSLHCDYSDCWLMSVIKWSCETFIWNLRALVPPDIIQFYMIS